MSDKQKIIQSTNPDYEKRYWMRVWIVASNIGTGWRTLPNSLSATWSSAKEFGHDLWLLLLHIVLPLTFIAAPLWLLMLERDNKKQAELRKKSAAAWADREVYADKRKSS